MLYEQQLSIAIRYELVSSLMLLLTSETFVFGAMHTNVFLFHQVGRTDRFMMRGILLGT